MTDQTNSIVLHGLAADSVENENGHVLLKTVEQDGTRVIFQYWLKSLTAEAYIRMRTKKVEAANQ
jgi:hypothetical protein